MEKMFFDAYNFDIQENAPWYVESRLESNDESDDESNDESDNESDNESD